MKNLDRGTLPIQIKIKGLRNAGKPVLVMDELWLRRSKAEEDVNYYMRQPEILYNFWAGTEHDPKIR